MFILIFPKTKIARSVNGPRLQGPHAEDAMAEPYSRTAKFGDLMTADHKVPSESCESRNKHMQSWCRTWPLNGSKHIRAEQKTSQETQRRLQKFLEPDRNPKVIYTDNSLEFGKPCEDVSWNHCMSTPHRTETNGIAKRAAPKVKEPLLYC